MYNDEENEIESETATTGPTAASVSV